MSRKLDVLALIVLVLTLFIGSSAWASSEKVLYRFHGKDGWGGGGSVILDSKGALYGATAYGGKNTCPGTDWGCGLAFRLTRNKEGKWGEKVLDSFDGSDGQGPSGQLILDRSGNLYGTAVYGGDYRSCSNLGCGVVFQLVRGTNGKWTDKTLHTFEVSDGAAPYGGLISDARGALYGTTWHGGNTSACAGGCGVVFKLTPGAGGKWAETVLYSFQGTDGEAPLANLTFDSVGNLYGTTELGGAHGWGTVFKLTPSKGHQWTETLLHSFDESDGSSPGYGLIIDDSGNLYGTTAFGGLYSWGVAFKLALGKNRKWTETVLHYFDEHMVGGGDLSSALVLDGVGNLYGTAAGGGKYTCPVGGDVPCGVVFRLTQQANGKWIETVLHSFGKGKDGAGPGGNLARDSAGHLFGMTGNGGYVGDPCGQDGCGVVFEIAP